MSKFMNGFEKISDKSKVDKFLEEHGILLISINGKLVYCAETCEKKDGGKDNE